MNFLIFLSGESRTPLIDVSGHSGRQYRFFYDEASKCMALDGKPSDSARLAEVAEDLIGVKGCFRVHLRCIPAAPAPVLTPAKETVIRPKAEPKAEPSDDSTFET